MLYSVTDQDNVSYKNNVQCHKLILYEITVYLVGKCDNEIWA
jgi:hypothetical protein